MPPRIVADACRFCIESLEELPSASASSLTGFRQLRDHLDFEVEPIQPRHADSSQRRVRRLAPIVAYHLPDPFQLGGGIDNEDRDVDDVFECAISGLQDCIEVVERQPDLCLQIGFGRSVRTAAGEYRLRSYNAWRQQLEARLRVKLLNRTTRQVKVTSDVALGTLLFGPAWTFDYWQAWVYLFVFAASCALITAYLWKKDPELLARRVNAGPGAEKEKSQKLIQQCASLVFIGMLILPSVDHRFSWSVVQLPVVIAGDILVTLGFLVVFLVFSRQ